MGGRGASSATASANSQRMTFNDFLQKYVSEDSIDGEYRFTDVPLEEITRLREEGLNSNTIFQLWLEDANDYGKANVVSSDELDKLIENGATEIYRGMPDSLRSSGDDKLNQIMYADKYYVGNGVYGDGLYFAKRIDVAGSYAADREGATGSVLRAVLKPDIKTITYSDARKAIREERRNFFAAYGDVSAWARSKGYDAIVAEVPENGTYYNILNREAIIMSDKLGRAKGSKRGGTIEF